MEEVRSEKKTFRKVRRLMAKIVCMLFWVMYVEMGMNSDNDVYGYELII